jgi:hypothetical protein
MSYSASGLGRFNGFFRFRLSASDFTSAAFGFDFGFCGRAEGIRGDSQFFGKFAVAKDFNPIGAAVGQTDGAQSGFIHAGAIVKFVQIADVDGDVLGGKTGVVKTALGDAADERHLAAFETNADAAAGTSGLALATATGGFAVTAGFALAEPLAAVLGAGTGF